MNKHDQKMRKQAILSRAILGALPATLLANVALAIPRMQTETRLSQLSSSATTPNSVTPKQADDKQILSISKQPAPGDVIQPPLPESQQSPSTIVKPVEGKVNIKLINTTKALVNYQVIGGTNQRTLNGDSDVTLQNIKTPITVTFGREDRGLLKVNSQATSSGLLEVLLNETTNLSEDKTTLVVQ